MRDPLFEYLGLHPFSVHVVRKKIPGLPGMQHDIGFGDGSAEGLAAVPDQILFKICGLYHQRFLSLSLGTKSCGRRRRATQRVAPTSR